MHRFAMPALAAAFLGLLIPTQAQSFTYGRLVAGQVRTALAYGTGASWCLVDNGNTTLQINQNNTKGAISFSEVIYFDGSTYYSLDGQTILTFSSTQLAEPYTLNRRRPIPLRYIVRPLPISPRPTIRRATS
jgi:hypothetical protein